MKQISTGSRSVTPDELAACRQDPAWEARQGIVAYVVCRVCAARIETRLAPRHLRRHQMSISEYRAAYPAARLYSFTCSAERHGDDPQRLMARFLAKYVTPEELEECRKNPQWEKDHKVTFVVCRVCGEKLHTDLKHHLQAKDGMSTTEYLTTYPGARLTSLSSYARTRARVKKNPGKEHAYQRTYRKTHPEKINAIQRRHYANRTPEQVQKDSERNQAKYKKLREKLKFAALHPQDWFQRPLDWRIIADPLIRTKGAASNETMARDLLLGGLLDLTNYGVTAEEISNSRAFVKRVNDIRNWLGWHGGRRYVRVAKPVSIH